ncbi:histidinol-phosphate transaminase [Gilvimarinus agarilyticus]|uniref:histidinol-phosphate transaminase n=1 Tax=unclassified Gilvimarinus TaxID=2642066 RepID=UPI001C08007B|nr:MULTISPECIES: histidinol-phosphate transaminase [unclassified Gilvimarinus]MBU2887604.1 histidinol-phosphate transaminase [Gilvimarinus agarilyticus]MDO6572255.1 histidinol-phosphate transaminase [Gilvimarinus sp. 2_MG-2023]MDO6746822.1 histidinol-phosphate transaminase [Gilvimarinus sp. 1_MG-2023]
MSKYWSEVVRTIEPYVPGEQPQVDGLIKLNTNESPYPPSPEVNRVLSQEVVDRLRFYPDPNATELRQSIARYYDLDAGYVFAGNSSDEVLAQTFMAFFQQEQPLLFPDITYGFYPVYCQLFGIESKKIPLTEDFTLGLEQYRQANGGIIFPNPNAPTGQLTPLEAIEALLVDNTESVVVVDEAYIDFGGASAVSLLERFENLLVVQTFSKSRALAGMRVGFALGNPALIEGLERVKNSFNSYPLDAIAQLAAQAAMEDRDYFDQCCRKVIATRVTTIDALVQLGFDVLPSQANFVMAKPPAHITAKHMAEKLRERKIIVRYFAKPRISDYLRISIGTDEQMQQLLVCVREILELTGVAE